MSDEDEEFEEGDEEEEDNEGEEEEEIDEEDEAVKKEKVSADLALIYDIFNHFECTSRRITESLLLKAELKQAAETIKSLESNSGNRNNDHGYSEDGDEEAEIEEESVTWSQYEELDEARRAKLLEKSLMLLAGLFLVVCTHVSLLNAAV